MGKQTIECDNGNNVYINELLGEYGMDKNNDSDKNTYNIYSENVVIGNKARVKSDNVTGNKIAQSVAGNYDAKPEKKWYENVILIIGLIASLIAIYTFVTPLSSDNNANNLSAVVSAAPEVILAPAPEVVPVPEPEVVSVPEPEVVSVSAPKVLAAPTTAVAPAPTTIQKKA